MNDNGKKLLLLNNSEIHHSKGIFNKISITPNKNLCKKYFYIDNKNAVNLKKFNTGKLLQLMDNKEANGDVLEQVDYIVTQFEQKKIDLNQKKVDCIKSMILNNKKIPEKWIMKSNYKDLLNEAMDDEIVLNYAIMCQDRYKKNLGLDQSDETRYQNFQKSKPKEKQFISYINPYSRNYFDSPVKKKIMNEYCLSIRRNNRNYIRSKYLYNNSLNGYERNSNITKQYNSDKSSNSLEGSGEFSKDKNKLPLINKKSRFYNEENSKNKNNNINKQYNNMNETNDELMVTSLQYSGIDMKKSKNEINQKNRMKLPELPLI